MTLEVEGLYKSFSGKEVLKGLSFTSRPGRALGLLGRNGAGKTTSLRILMGLFPADAGQVRWQARPFRGIDKKVGYLPEERGLYPKEKILGQLSYFGRLRGLSKDEAAQSAGYWLRRLGLEGEASSRLDTLSKGNQQKVQIAQALLGDPDMVILDEPFSGLDPVNAQVLKELVFELIDKEKTVIFSSHQMAYVETFCKDVAIIDQGRIVLAGDINQLKEDRGADRLIVKARDRGGQALMDTLKGPGRLRRGLRLKDDQVLVDLGADFSQRDLLALLLNLQVPIDYLGYQKPSLEDIFVSAVEEEGA